MGYLAIALLLAACVAVWVAWGGSRRHHHEVIGSELIYPDGHEPARSRL